MLVARLLKAETVTLFTLTSDIVVIGQPCPHQTYNRFSSAETCLVQHV